MVLIKKEFLLRHYPKFESEIEQSVDLGRQVSISPLYTFYYSKGTGLQFLKNAELVRVYRELEYHTLPRSPYSFIIFETKSPQKTVRLRGNADDLKMKKAYDIFCPHILIGQEGQEMDQEKLQTRITMRKRSLFVSLITLLCWSILLHAANQYLSTKLVLFIFAVSTTILITILVLIIRSLIKK